MNASRPVSRNRRRLATVCWSIVFPVGVLQAVLGWREGDHVRGFFGALQALSALGLLVLRISEERHRRNAAREPHGHDGP